MLGANAGRQCWAPMSGLAPLDIQESRLDRPWGAVATLLLVRTIRISCRFREVSKS